MWERLMDWFKVEQISYCNPGEKKKSYHAMKLWTIFSDPTASNAR